MEYKKVKRCFRVVGIKGYGAYVNFDVEVPKLARQVMKRMDEIEHCSGTEIAFFEPKQNGNHLEGNYYVGFIVNESLSKVPSGMEYIESNQVYFKTRGNINEIANLHNDLLQWIEDQGYIRNQNAYIIETYHPMENGLEEVEIFLPILT
ncbi:GyrI-like domain-containing protein [Bacillus sp. REN16]|uniref:GyrI-like domain-containing protein n=1 Tax=Bacillus sp. REN16 TaxID=2887296 RepID=UPI001E5C0EE6|nr:GyrI-like domain-containing protein [Bacillus sp. REN16]MCC3359244.1 GyrI-like domain-containing protein [Bacillus sp. REN16]